MSTESTIDGTPIPTLDDIAEQHMTLAPWVARTPTFEKHDFPTLDDTRITFKFELLQVSGTFKARGAFSNILALTDSERGAGVTCVSGGNHAVAVAYAAQRMDVGAKVIVVKTASPARIALCRRYGAEVVLAENLLEAFDIVRRVEAEEGRVFIHPFNGYRTVLGTATLGYEWTSQAPDLDAVIVPIGGGGLAAGVSTAMRLANPSIHIYGVEPSGADAMYRSFAANHTIKLDSMHSIADSLMAPHTEQYSYELCRRHIDEIVTVSDDELRNAMQQLFSEMKLAVEPACAAATAALLGPLRERLQGKRVGVLLCGTNTDVGTFSRHVSA
jgi:threonine dehydratase